MEEIESMSSEKKCYSKIKIDSSGRETICDAEKDYPFHFYPEHMEQYDMRTIDWHWHPEVEVLYIESGRIRCMVGSKHFDAFAGQYVFVNSRVIHSFTSDEDASIPNFLFLPSLITCQENLVYEKYIQPVLASPQPYLLATPKKTKTSFEQSVILFLYN